MSLQSQCDQCGFDEFYLSVDKVLFTYQTDGSEEGELICTFRLEESPEDGIRKQCKECGHEEYIYDFEELGFLLSD